MSLTVGLTAPEMKYEAQIIYEGIASATAPGYTDKEWSVLLTQAQEKIIRKLLDSGLERNEFTRKAIGSLIRHRDLTTFDVGPSSYPYSYSVILPDNPELKILGIMTEYIDGTLNSVSKSNVKVKPISYEYYWSNHNNPFRKPSSTEDGYFWRLDLNNEDLNQSSSLIITDGTIPYTYKMDYVERPTPIIITTLTGTTIEGESDQMDCQLHHSIHRMIVKEAATLAFAALQEQVGYQMQKMENKS
jgi:hypothetical protein